MPRTEAAPRDDEPARRNDDDDDEHRRGSVEGEARPRATLPLRCRRWWWCGRRRTGGGRADRGNSGEADGEAGAARRCSGEIRATPWPGRERGRRSGAGRGGGDVGRRTGDAAEAAGGGIVVATPLLPAGRHFRRSPRETEGRPAKNILFGVSKFFGYHRSSSLSWFEL